MDDKTLLSTDAIDEAATGDATTKEQTPDTPGHDENGDGLKGGQATADVVGDVLGI